MKYLVVAAFVGILVSLGSALFFMMRNGNNDALKGNRMARALAVRGGAVDLALCVPAGRMATGLHPAYRPAGHALNASRSQKTQPRLALSKAS